MSKNPMTEVAMHAVKGGMPVKDAAKAAEVHRTTIWRALKKAKETAGKLEQVRGSAKREGLEMLLHRQMELIYDAMQRLSPEELDKQAAPFLKDLARTGTVNLGILTDKITKLEETSAGGDNTIEVVVRGYDLPKAMVSVISGEPSAQLPPIEIDE